MHQIKPWVDDVNPWGMLDLWCLRACFVGISMPNRESACALLSSGPDASTLPRQGTTTRHHLYTASTERREPHNYTALRGTLQSVCVDVELCTAENYRAWDK